MRSPSCEGVPGSAVRTMSPCPLPSGLFQVSQFESEVADDRVSVVLAVVAGAGDRTSSSLPSPSEAM
jgi:hypothetical protein